MAADNLVIPKHIAIIMDGNGRWAKKRSLPRTYGHIKGADTLEQVLKDCNDLGVGYLTVYAFSTENWARPLEEVQVIMNLIRNYLKSAVEKCRKNNVRCQIIGDRTKLAPDILEAARHLEEETKDFTGIVFTIAINYGSRDEILRGIRKVAQKVQTGEIKPEDIDEKIMENSFDTAGMPDPDLLIRTSGEERLSNFLMWQLAYTEFYFTDVLWPDFNKDELIKAIKKFSERDRRYGGVK